MATVRMPCGCWRDESPAASSDSLITCGKMPSKKSSNTSARCLVGSRGRGDAGGRCGGGGSGEGGGGGGGGGEGSGEGGGGGGGTGGREGSGGGRGVCVMVAAM